MEELQFEQALVDLAKTMGFSSNDLLLFAKECREQDGVKTSVDGFDELMKFIIEEKNV